MRKRVIIGSFTLFLVTLISVGVITQVVSVKLQGRNSRPTIGAVRSQIRDLQTLVTQEYTYRDIVFFDEETRLLGVRTGSKQVLFAVEIRVIAGIDFSDAIEVEYLDRDRRRAFVTLPEPTILRVDAVEDTIDQYFVREGFTSIDWRAVSVEVEAAKERNRRDAIERGVLTDAKERSERLIRDMLQEIGFQEVEVRFRPTEREGLRG